MEPLDPLGSSDHIGIKWKVNLTAPAEETAVVKLDYGKADYNRLNKQLSDVDWSTIIDFGTVEQSWKNMKEAIRTIVEDCVPVRQMKSDKRKSLPYNIRKEIRKRNTLWKKYKITERAGDYELYKQQRNIAKNKINRWKEEAEQKVVLSLNRDKKKFYSYVRNKQHIRSGIGQIKNEDGDLTKSNVETAQVFGNFFQSVFSKEDDYTFVPDDRDTKIPNDEKINDVEINEETVRKKLTKLKENKSSGPDGINPKILKACTESLAKPLANFYRKSLDHMELPSDWKVAEVVPIFKSGNRSEASNYRPISLTSIPCKIMESIILDKLSEHLQKLNIPNDHQHGFRKGRSCLTNLLVCLEDWTSNIDQGHPVDVIYLDIRDVVSVSTSRSRDGLETYRRSRLGLVSGM